VTYTFSAERADEAAGMLAHLAALSRLERGCSGFEACRSNDDPRVFVLFEQWENEAALDTHYTTDHFTKLGVNGIQAIAESRVAHKCTPLIA
jgi:autoinducer 2-degrading protein